jgi:oxygen-independent coproporphyrinogen-3 oxidase
MRIYRDRFPIFDTLYLGGGTPSVLSTRQWSYLMETLFRCFNIASGAEITVEANPDDITPDLTARLYGLGVNRISLGVQSFNDRELLYLKRRHNASGAMQALDCIRAGGFSNVGLDLMYGIPGQGEDTWLATLGRALKFSPEHISCYQFTVEDGTPFGRMLERGMIAPPDEERERAFFVRTSRLLENEGYVHYEISSYARGIERSSLHNMKYWRHLPYLGLGPSAHSFDGHRRWWNLDSLGDYCQALGRGKAPVAAHEILSEEQHRMESLMLGLRIRDGFAQHILEKNSEHEKLLKDLEGGGLVRIEKGRVRPTVKGFIVADSIPMLFSV